MTSDFSAGRKDQSDPKKMTSHGRSKIRKIQTFEYIFNELFFFDIKSNIGYLIQLTRK